MGTKECMSLSMGQLLLVKLDHLVIYHTHGRSLEGKVSQLESKMIIYRKSFAVACILILPINRATDYTWL